MASHVMNGDRAGKDKPNNQRNTEYSEAYNSRNTNTLPKNHTNSYKCGENRYYDTTQVRNSIMVYNYLKTHLEDDIEYPIRRTEPCPCNGNFTTGPPQNHIHQYPLKRTLSPVLGLLLDVSNIHQPALEQRGGVCSNPSLIEEINTQLLGSQETHLLDSLFNERFKKCNGQVQVGLYAGGAAGKALVYYKCIKKYQDISSTESQVSSKINEHFVQSLRKYPIVLKTSKSKDFIGRMLAFTQRKHSSKTDNQPSPYEKPTKKHSKQKITIINKAKSNIKMKPQNSTSESSKHGVTRSIKDSIDKYSLLYDYYKSLPKNHQVTFWGRQGCIEVRYLSTTQMIKNKFMSLIDTSPTSPSCPTMAERYNQHLQCCPKKDCICQEAPTIETKKCSCRTKKNKSWKSGCDNTLCPCSPVSRIISNIVQRFEQEIPIYPNENLIHKQERSKLLKEMADELIKLSKTKDMTTAKTVILKYLDKMPMWLPKKGNDDEFKEHMADMLLERMRGPKPEIDEQELRQIVADLPFRNKVTNPKIRREDEITSIVNKLKNIPTDENDHLKEDITSILCDLPLSVNPRKLNQFYENTADELMSVLDTSEYEKAIKEIIWDWVQETPPVAAYGVEETETNKLTKEIIQEKNKLDVQSKEEKKIISAWFETVNEDTQAKIDKITEMEAINKLTENLMYAKKETKFKFRLPSFHISHHNVRRLEYDSSNMNNLRDEFLCKSDENISRFIAKERISDCINVKLESMVTDWVYSIPELCDVQREKIDELIVSLQNLVEEYYKIKTKIKETNAKWLTLLFSKTNKYVELEVIDYLSEDLLDNIVYANKYDKITNETKNQLNDYVQQVVLNWVEEIPQFKKPGKDIYREIRDNSSQFLVSSLTDCVQKRSPNEIIEAKIIEWIYPILSKYNIHIDPRTRVNVVEKLMNRLTEFITDNGKNIAALVRDWVDNTEEFKKYPSKLEIIKADSNILIKRIERIISVPSYSFEDVKDEIMDWIGFTLKLNNISITPEAKYMISEQLTHLLRRQEELNTLIVDWLSEIVPFSELKKNHKINNDSDTSESMYDEDKTLENVNELLHGKSSNSSDEFIDQAINEKRNRIIEQSNKIFQNHIFDWINCYQEFKNQNYQNIIEESKTLAKALNELYTQDSDEKAFRDEIDEWLDYISNKYSIKLRGCQKLIMAGKLLKNTRNKKTTIPCFNFKTETDKFKPYDVQNAETLNRIQNIAEALSTKINTMLANGSTDAEIKEEAMHWLDKVADTAKCILNQPFKVKMVDKLLKKVNKIVYWQDWIKNINLHETEYPSMKKESLAYDSKNCINRIKNLQINVVDSCQTKREAMKLIHSILGKYGLSCRCKEMIADKTVREMKLKAMIKSRGSLGELGGRCFCLLKNKIPIKDRQLILTASNLYAIYIEIIPEYQEMFPELTDELNDELDGITDKIKEIIAEYDDDTEIRDIVFCVIRDNLLEHDISPGDAKINEVVDRILQEPSDNLESDRGNLNPEKLFGIIQAEIPEFARKYPKLTDDFKKSLKKVLNPIQDLISKDASEGDIEDVAKEVIKTFLEESGISASDNEVDNIVNKLLEKQRPGTSGISGKTPKKRLSFSEESRPQASDRSKTNDEYSKPKVSEQSRYQTKSPDSDSGASSSDPTLSRLAKGNPKAVGSKNKALDNKMSKGASDGGNRKKLEKIARDQGVPPRDIDKVVNGMMQQNKDSGQSRKISPAQSKTMDPALSRFGKENPKENSRDKTALNKSRTTGTQVDDSLNNKRKKWGKQPINKKGDDTLSNSDKYREDSDKATSQDLESQGSEGIPSAPLNKSEIAEIVEDWLDSIPAVISDPNQKEEVIENLSNYLADKMEFYDENSDIKITDPDQVDEIKSRALEIFQDANVPDPEAFMKYIDDLINKLNKANIAKKSAAGPPRPSKTNALDNIRKIIRDWCQKLPFPKTETEEEKVEQDALRDEIAQKLINDVEGLFSTLEILNDEFIFEKELDKAIESAYTMLPITPELQKKKPHLIQDLKEKLMGERKKMESQSENQNIKKRMKQLIKLELPERVCMNQDDVNVLKIALDNIADAYLNMAFEPDAIVKYQKKKAFIDEIDEYLNYITRYPGICILYEEVESDICSVLCEFIKSISLDFIVNELARIAIKEIINEWLKKMPIKKELFSDDLLTINKMISVLASRLYEMESKEEPDYKDMQDEIHDWLTKIPCEDDGELRSHAEDLVQRLIESLETRKDSIQQVILELSSIGVETNFNEKETTLEDSSLTCEDRALLNRIRRRCSLRSSNCVDLPPMPHLKPFSQCNPSRCGSKANDICMIPKPCPQRPSIARCPKRNSPCPSNFSAAPSSCSGLNSTGCGSVPLSPRCSPPCSINRPMSSKCTPKIPDCLIPHLPPCVSQSKCGEGASRKFCIPRFVPHLSDRSNRNKPLSSCGVGCLQRKPERPLFPFNQTPSDGASRKCFLNYSNPVPTHEKGVQASCRINNPRAYDCSGHCLRSRNPELENDVSSMPITRNLMQTSRPSNAERSTQEGQTRISDANAKIPLGNCKLTKPCPRSCGSLNGSLEESVLADNCLENDEQCQTDLSCRDTAECSHRRLDTSECHRRTRSCVQPVSDNCQSRHGCHGWLDGTSRNNFGNGRFRATISSKRLDCKCSSIIQTESKYCQPKQILHHILQTSDMPSNSSRTCVNYPRPVIDCLPHAKQKFCPNNSRKKCPKYSRNEIHDCGQCSRLPCPFPAKLYFDH